MEYERMPWFSNHPVVFVEQMDEPFSFALFSSQFSGFEIGRLRSEAQNRWLRPAEVLFILENYAECSITPESPNQPPSNLHILLILWRIAFSLNACEISWSSLVLTLQQAGLCFSLTGECCDFSVMMVTCGGERRMGELWEKHMRGSRSVNQFSLFFFFFFKLIWWMIKSSVKSFFCRVNLCHLWFINHCWNFSMILRDHLAQPIQGLEMKGGFQTYWVI